ncbi:MAG TPA: hypothetical protein VMU59_05480 [Caulobacteraceae bacterium]|nr:hypothetical protein [Caulobacteraceae bacterium]
MKRLIVTLAAVGMLGGALAACETATPYQPLAPGNASQGGYAETKLNDDVWRVTFSGNSLTSRDTVERYLLYRAAELTVNQGFDWFLDTHRATDKKTSYEVDPFYATGPGFGWGYGFRPSWRFGGPWGWRGYDPWGPGLWGPGPYSVDQITRYETSAEIRMGHGDKPPGAIDARQVLTNLGPTIMRPQPAAH